MSTASVFSSSARWSTPAMICSIGRRSWRTSTPPTTNAPMNGQGPNTPADHRIAAASVASPTIASATRQAASCAGKPSGARTAQAVSASSRTSSFTASAHIARSWRRSTRGPSSADRALPPARHRRAGRRLQPRRQRRAPDRRARHAQQLEQPARCQTDPDPPRKGASPPPPGTTRPRHPCPPSDLRSERCRPRTAPPPRAGARAARALGHARSPAPGTPRPARSTSARRSGGEPRTPR